MDRVSEVLGHHYELAWPTAEFQSGRDLKLSPIHDRLAAVGACFGQRMGWERPLWSAGPGQTPIFDQSWGRASWFDRWAAEHQAAREAVALFDQSSFGKLRVTGPDALRLLNHVSANEIDVEPGRLVYTAWLDRHGRFVSDLTVVRHGLDDFAVMTAAIQPIHDRDWLDRQARVIAADVCIEDVTDQTAVLGVMGPNSRALLNRVTDADLSNEAFPFAAARSITINGVALFAQRVTYVGELGWELHISASDAVLVYDALIDSGRDLGLTPAGTMAMNSLRMEKAYVSWSHDVSRDDTPLEAGLGFASGVGQAQRLHRPRRPDRAARIGNPQAPGHLRPRQSRAAALGPRADPARRCPGWLHDLRQLRAYARIGHRHGLRERRQSDHAPMGRIRPV